MHIPSDHEIETVSGNFVDVSKPDPATIDIHDIAHALAATCRYGGHSKVFYSVAEHAVFVSKRLERQGHKRLVQLAGLHHDDAEAYLGDIPRPFKPLLGRSYERMSDRMDAAIVEALELPFDSSAFHSSYVKSADNWSLLVEARYLLPSQGKGWQEGQQGSNSWGLDDQPSRIVTPDYWHGGLTPSIASGMFLARHAELTGPSDEGSAS